MFVLWLYCLLAFVAALAGGALPSLFKLTHPRLQIAISFVAGLMLGLAVLGLWPHGVDILGSAERGAGWLLAGFLALFFMQRFLPFHHHDVAEGSPLEPCGHPHSLAERSARTLSWLGVALGLSLHSIFDGVAMAAAVAAGAREHGGALGLGTALAVILHKPFSALAITTLMAAGGTAGTLRHLVNVAFALVTPVGALLFYLGVDLAGAQHAPWLGAALAFCAGTFLSIACADLLPELQFHRHDRIKLTVALLAGLAVALLIVKLGHEPHAHEQATPAQPPRVAPADATSPPASSAPTRVGRGGGVTRDRAFGSVSPKRARAGTVVAGGRPARVSA